MASASAFKDEYSSSDEIPEIDLTLSIRPYMFEPLRVERVEENTDEESSESESSGDDGDVSLDASEAIPAQRVDEWYV